MTDDRYTQLKPPHLVSALRSFPRRYREALASMPPDPDLLVRPVDGHTVLALLADTAHTLELIGRALERTLVHDEPEIDAAVFDGAARRPPRHEPADSAALLDELATHATALADQADRASTSDWTRTAEVDGRRVRSVDMVREGVRTAAENLRLIERIIPSLAG